MVGDIVLRVQIDDFGNGLDCPFPDDCFIVSAQVLQILQYGDVLVVEEGTEN